LSFCKGKFGDDELFFIASLSNDERIQKKKGSDPGSLPFLKYQALLDYFFFLAAFFLAAFFAGFFAIAFNVLRLNNT
jgi:hypothetical protein